MPPPAITTFLGLAVLGRWRPSPGQLVADPRGTEEIKFAATAPPAALNRSRRFKGSSFIGLETSPLILLEPAAEGNCFSLKEICSGKAPIRRNGRHHDASRRKTLVRLSVADAIEISADIHQLTSCQGKGIRAGSKNATAAAQ